MPTPSAVVADAVGTPSVAEAAALLGAGPGAELIVHKQANAVATVAVARRAGPPGRLRVVGLGPGGAALRTPAAETAVRHAQVVIGYSPYVEACADLLQPHQEVVRSPIGEEVVRAKQALAEAAGAREVALVCSGDPGVYAMASITLELAADAPGVEIEIVPGVTAAHAAAAAVGAPLGHDFATISLSDLLTPWESIGRAFERRRPPTSPWRSTTHARAAGRGSSTPPAESSSSTAHPRRRSPSSPTQPAPASTSRSPRSPTSIRRRSE